MTELTLVLATIVGLAITAVAILRDVGLRRLRGGPAATFDVAGRTLSA